MADESRKQEAPTRLDWTKGTSALLAALTFLFGVATYLHQQNKQAEALSRQRDVEAEQRKLEEQNAQENRKQTLERRDRELSQRFREEQFSLYQKAIDAAALLATRGPSTKDAAVKSALQDFWTLYWGKLSMVESKEVVTAMVDFGTGLNRCDAPNTKT